MNLPTQDQLIDQAQQEFHELIDFLRTQSQQQTRLDRVERRLFSLLLELGRTLLKAFIAGEGLGDRGPEMTVGERTLKRSPRPHHRWYRSIFGKLAIWRWV